MQFFHFLLSTFKIMSYLCNAFRRNRWREEVLSVMLRWNDKQI